MAISCHHSKAGLRNYIGRPSSEKIRACSNILSDTLSGNSHQSLWPSFAALSSRAIFMFRLIRLSFIQKTFALNSLFSTFSCEKTRVFLWAIIRLKFAEHFTSRFCLRDLKNYRPSRPRFQGPLFSSREEEREDPGNAIVSLVPATPRS